MKKYFFSLFFIVLLLGCGSQENSKSIKNSNTHFTLFKAPIGTDPIAINQKIVLNFSAALDVNSVNSSSVYIVDDKNESISLEMWLDTAKVTLTPDEYFKPSSTYTIVVTTDVKDTNGSSLSQKYQFPFMTLADIPDTTALQIRAVKPYDNSYDAPLNSDIVLDFNKNISLNSDTLELSVKDENGSDINGSVVVFNTLLKFIPNDDLPADSNISVAFNSEVKDIYGTSYPIEHKWKFTTMPKKWYTYLIEGFQSLVSLKTEKTSYLVRTLSNDENNSLIVVARDGGLDLYSVNYAEFIQKPTISFKSSFALADTVTDMDVVDSHNLAVATLGGGLYHLKIEDATLSLHAHYLDKESLYRVMHTEDFKNLFVVGPEYGLGEFDLNQTKEEVDFVAHYDINETKVPLDIALQNQQYYIADYSGGVGVYDENMSFVKYVEMNASIKKVMLEPDGEGSSSGVAALASSGNGFEMQDTNVTDTGSFIPGAVYSTNSATIGYANVIFVSMLEKGLLLHQPYYEMDYYIDTFGINVAADSVDASWSRYDKTPFIVTLNSDGVLNVFNGRADTSKPLIFTNPSNLESDGLVYDQNLSLSFIDPYLDSTTITQDKFTLKDETNNSLVEYSYKANVDESGDFHVNIDPKKDLTVDNNYSITIDSGISNMLGNRIQQTTTYKFSAVAPQ